jgi:hypothetical protein
MACRRLAFESAGTLARGFAPTPGCDGAGGGTLPLRPNSEGGILGR